jgi:hypothetical protein
VRAIPHAGPAMREGFRAVGSGWESGGPVRTGASEYRFDCPTSQVLRAMGLRPSAGPE